MDPETTGVPTPKGRRRWPIRLLVVALVVILVAGGIWGLRVRQEMIWVAQADVAVADYLTRHPDAEINEGVKLRDKYGDFHGLVGTSYSYPAWNIQGYHYLIAHRTANFSKGSVPMRIYVTEGSKTAPGKSELTVDPKLMWDGGNLDIRVSHPDLRR